MMIADDGETLGGWRLVERRQLLSSGELDEAAGDSALRSSRTSPDAASRRPTGVASLALAVCESLSCSAPLFRLNHGVHDQRHGTSS